MVGEAVAGGDVIGAMVVEGCWSMFVTAVVGDGRLGGVVAIGERFTGCVVAPGS